MATLRITLEIVVDDADERLCGDCRFAEEDACSAFTDDGCPSEFSHYTETGTPVRVPACLAASALATADEAVLSAAEKWGDDEDVTLDEANAQADALQDAIDARRKLRTPKGTG